MVKITEIPMGDKIRAKFMSFFTLTETSEQDWEFKEVISSEMLKVPNNPYAGVQSSCSICFHGLKNIAVFKHKETKKMVGAGLVCASNMMALQKYDGDMDELNFDRQIKLQKKTIIKRMLEAQAESGKIILETKHFEEMQWLYALIEEAKHRYEEYFRGDFQNTRELEDIYKDALEFFISIYNQVERKGKLSDNQIVAIGKCMVKQSIEKRFDNLDYKLEMAWGEIAFRRMYQNHFTVVRNLLTPFKHSLSSYDKKTIESLKNWFDEKQFYTKKQMDLIYTIASRYEKELKEYTSWLDKERETWDKYMQEVA